MLTTKEETTPDPDRSGEDDVIESRDAPTVFQQENSDDSDDQEESNQGYQIINQEDEEGEDQDHEDGEAEAEEENTNKFSYSAPVKNFRLTGEFAAEDNPEVVKYNRNS